MINYDYLQECHVKMTSTHTHMYIMYTFTSTLKNTLLCTQIYSLHEGNIPGVGGWMGGKMDVRVT